MLVPAFGKFRASVKLGLTDLHVEFPLYSTQPRRAIDEAIGDEAQGVFSVGEISKIEIKIEKDYSVDFDNHVAPW